MSARRSRAFDSLVRSTAEQTLRSSATGKLAALDENGLYELLARRALPKSPGGIDAQFRSRPHGDGELAEFGKRLFYRWSKALHEFVCSSSEGDKELQDSVRKAFGLKEGGAAMIGGVLVAAFGLQPAIAAVIAALLLRIVVAPAKEELCATWQASLKGSAPRKQRGAKK